MDDTRKQSLARLLEAAAVKNVHGPAAVARGLNVSDQTINNWKSRGVPHAKTIEAQTLWGVSAHWISTGEGDTWVADLPSRNQGTSVKSLCDEQAHEEPAVHVPLLKNSGSMGPGTDVEHDDVIVGTIALSPDWISKRIRPSTPEALRFIHAYGDSMHPTFEDGDVLLVDTGRRDPSGADGVYVLATDKRVFIKRVTERFNGGHDVTSDNPTVKTVQELNGGNEIRVLGRVVWVWNGRKL